MRQSPIGIDIIEIDRIRESISRWGDHFLMRIYTARELEIFRDKTESLAVRFAGKEAAMKALNAPARGVSWLDIEILADPSGKPSVKLYGQAKTLLGEMGLSGLEISLSHSRQNAIALVIGVRED